jgi:LysM repeat protein
MNSYRQVTLGILAVLVSIAIVFGSLMMGLVEGGLHLTIPQDETGLPAFSATLTPTPMPGTPTAIPLSDTPLPSESPSVTPTPSCIPPLGWVVIIIQPGDTLSSLAQTYDTTVKKLKVANCLLTEDLIPGTEFYVPQPEPTSTVPTATVYQCGVPYGWVAYYVKSGDTLYSIAQMSGTTVAALQQANCLGNSDYIYVGQKLYVPYYATATPGIMTPTPSETVMPSETPAPGETVLPTEMPTATETPVQDTPTPMPTPTYTDPSTPTPGLVDPTERPTPAFTPLPTIDPTLIAPIPY